MKKSMLRGSPSRAAMLAMVVGTALTVSRASAENDARAKAIGDIHRYCTACWRNARIPADSWSDCTQEVLCRLMQNIPVDHWGHILKSEGEERREFVRAIDAVKKRTQRARKWAPLNDVAVDRRRIGGSDLTDRREQLNRAVTESLSPRQQRIVQMSIDGYSVQEMAEELTMTPERVSDEKYKAIRKLRRELGNDSSV